MPWLRRCCGMNQSTVNGTAADVPKGQEESSSSACLHVEGLLQQRGWKVVDVHGGIFEADRKKAVVSFQKGSSSVLVATNVAARGLVIPNVDYIINYSFFYTFEDYECRLRQTGQTGRKGIMHTFFMPGNQARAKELVEVLREAEEDVPENLLMLMSPTQTKPKIEY